MAGNFDKRLQKMEDLVYVDPDIEALCERDFTTLTDEELWWIICGEKKPLPPDDEFDAAMKQKRIEIFEESDEETI